MEWPPDALAAAKIAADGKVVTADVPVQGGKERHFDPWLAVGSTGLVHAVWLQYDGNGPAISHQQIAYATSTDGKIWSKAIAVNDPADCLGDAQDCLDKPMIAVVPAASATDPMKSTFLLRQRHKWHESGAFVGWGCVFF